jgi:hypothetical protein
MLLHALLVLRRATTLQSAAREPVRPLLNAAPRRGLPMLLLLLLHLSQRVTKHLWQLQLHCCWVQERQSP